MPGTHVYESMICGTNSIFFKDEIWQRNCEFSFKSSLVNWILKNLSNPWRYCLSNEMTIRSVWHSTLYSAAVTIVIKNVINPRFLVGSTILVIFLWLNGSFFFHISCSEIKSRYLSDYRRIWEWWHHRIVNKIINNLIMESHGLSFFTTVCESEMILQKSDIGNKPKLMIKITSVSFVPHEVKIWLKWCWWQVDVHLMLMMICRRWCWKNFDVDDIFWI